MAERTKHPPSILFTVRVWAEEKEKGKQEWRGTARRLPDGQELPFRGWPALITLLEKMSRGGN